MDNGNPLPSVRNQPTEFSLYYVNRDKCPDKPVRVSIGLNKNKNILDEIYFLTICTNQRICYFGDIVDGTMISFSICEALREMWQEITKKFNDVRQDMFVIMPNHIHGILCINGYRCCGTNKNEELSNSQSDQKIKELLLKEQSHSVLHEAIKFFKTRTSELIHNSGCDSFQWDKSYYEYKVQTEEELESIREYIINNPIIWMWDRENCLSKNYGMDIEQYYSFILKK